MGAQKRAVKLRKAARSALIKYTLSKIVSVQVPHVNAALLFCESELYNGMYDFYVKAIIGGIQK